MKFFFTIRKMQINENFISGIEIELLKCLFYFLQ